MVTIPNVCTVYDHGTICLVEPATEAVAEHLREHTDDEAIWFGPSLVVEPRYLQALLESLCEHFTPNT